MTIKKTKKSDVIFLPLEAYESLVKEVEEYKELQKKEGVRWVKVRVNEPVKKPSKSTRKTSSK